MTNLLISLFIKDKENVKDAKVRNAYGKMAGIVGICCNIFLFATKFFAGIITGAISITADAFNNLSDAASSIITLVGFGMAGKPADEDHPFGHGRMEYVSGLVVSILILMMGVELFKTSVEKVIHPEVITEQWISYVILVISIALKFWMYMFNKGIGWRIHSETMKATAEEIEAIFAKRLNKEDITKEEELKFKTAFMQFVAKQYHKRDWVMQIHYGCRRDNNTPYYKRLGPDTGYDCIDNYAPSAQTAAFLDSINATEELPKTILYSLNPNDNEAIGTILGCFQDSSAAGKIQQGSAWWFNDHKTGMINQMTSLANLGLLGNFIGMLTDSRSFLSYTRHEYFRRILCNLIGGWVENGEYPDDEKSLKKIVEGISYNNAVRYFKFDL